MYTPSFSYKKYMTTFGIILLSLLSTLEAREIASRSRYSQNCVEIVSELISQGVPSTGQTGRSARQALPETVLERELKRLGVSDQTADQRLTRLINELEEISPDEATLARNAARIFENSGYTPLRYDTSALPHKMIRFLEGPFTRAHGKKALHGPFIRFEALNANTLLIYHTDDLYPILVVWDDVLVPQINLRPKNFIPPRGASQQIVKQTIEDDFLGYQVLTLPRNYTDQRTLNTLSPEVYQVSAASRFHPYKWEADSLRSRIRTLIFSDSEVALRPTQREFDDLRTLLNEDLDVRANVKSLLFVAPTGTGKTRILGLGVTDKVKSFRPGSEKKLNLVLANNANIVDQLGRDIGKQVLEDVGAGRVRLLQWGGSNSDQMTVDQLIRTLDQSDVPIVLVSSFQSMASRVREDQKLFEVMKRASFLGIDEAHNSTGKTYKRVMAQALEVAKRDREASAHVRDSLDILGVTATPYSRSSTIRTVDLFDYTYRAGEMTPRQFAYQVRRGSTLERSAVKNDILEWYSIEKQRRLAAMRGEINSPENFTFIRPNRSMFETRNGQPRVVITRLKEEWKKILPDLDVRAPGIVHAYPRDAKNVAEALSSVTKKNYVTDAGLTVRQRDELYDAFKFGKEYKGKKIDGLVIGRMKLEGLDFPDAGWFVSLKRYTYFPDNIQEAGRAMRLAHDKPTPAIFFFAENTGASIYRTVRDFVMSKMGALPRQMAKGRGFVGARNFQNSYPGSLLGESTMGLNVSLELLFRQNPELAQAFARGEKPITNLQDLVGLTIRRQGNQEASRELRTFVNQVSSYPFFQGNLRSTWNYADRLLRIKRAGRPFPANLNPSDLFILNSKKLIDEVAEFREMRSWIGNIARDVVQDMDLAPRGVVDMSEVLDTFVARYGEDSLKYLDSWYFKSALDDMLGVSSPGVWNRLGPVARNELSGLFGEADRVVFEEALEQFILRNGNLPGFYFHKLGTDEVIGMSDKIAHRLAERLEARLQTGTLRLDRLSPEILKSIDESPFYQRLLGQALGAVDSELRLAREMRGQQSLSISLNQILGENGIALFRTVREMANENYSNSRQAMKLLEDILNP